MYNISIQRDTVLEDFKKITAILIDQAKATYLEIKSVAKEKAFLKGYEVNRK